MLNLLGIDKIVFEGVSTLEKAAFRTATISFLIVAVLSIVANGYFGHSLYGTWWAVILFAGFMGFVQFSILRIALITLMTKSLAQEAEVVHTPAPAATHSKVKDFLARFSNIKIRIASVFRVLFVGMIALCMAFPLGSFIMNESSLRIEQEYKQDLNERFKEQLSQSQLKHDVQQANFPFHVYNELLNETEFQMLILVIVFIVFIPLILVARLRNNSSFEYIEKSRMKMLELVAIDYDETMEQSQYYLQNYFPTNNKVLKDLSVYADAPINSIYKEERKYSKGDKTAFNQFIQSI
jgi:hypothetical protein